MTTTLQAQPKGSATSPTEQRQEWQLNMFGPPELMNNLSNRDQLRDDAPVPAERELLWPADLSRLIGTILLETLYGDVPRRTRLRIEEICRRMRISKEHVRRLIEAGSLDATDIRHPKAIEPSHRVYRYSLIVWLFNRDFRDTESPRCNLPPEDLDRINYAITEMEE